MDKRANLKYEINQKTKDIALINRDIKYYKSNIFYNQVKHEQNMVKSLESRVRLTKKERTQLKIELKLLDNDPTYKQAEKELLDNINRCLDKLINPMKMDRTDLIIIKQLLLNNLKD